jgi:lysophospholipase
MLDFLSLLLVVTPVIATYAPQSTICPTTSLVRAATGLSDDEETYRVARKAVADDALRSWLANIDPGFGTAGELPTVSRPINQSYYANK